MGWLQTLAAEFTITVSNGDVWLSIGQAFLFGGVCLLFGTWVARKVGLLDTNATAGETLGVGLASGLLVLAAWWAALASGGRSSFTPVAFGFALAIALALARSFRSPAGEYATTPPEMVRELTASRASLRKNLIMAVILSGGFITAVALLYGSTMALSPRDGVQPLEFMDEAFYSILGADLAKTGTETIYSPSGFPQLEGLPTQTWYHWGELWLASAVIKVFGAEALHARHFIVLPVLLLAAAALTGTLVRRMAGTKSRGAFLFGFLACLFLAPVPLLPGPFFSSWTVGLIFGITTYGLAAVTVLLAMYAAAVLVTRTSTWGIAVFVGGIAASILPAHVVIALLGLLGVGSVFVLRIARAFVTTRRLPVVPPVWRRTLIASGIGIIATLIWGLLMGHGVGTSGLSASVAPFNASWRESVAITVLGSAAFFAIGIAWVLARKEELAHADAFVGVGVLLAAGAIAWGARLGDFTMFHVFYGGIAVFATPVAAFAVWSIWMRLRATNHKFLAFAVLVLCIAQLEIGIGLGILRLQRFGPGDYEPVPMSILTAMRGALPQDAKLAYTCLPFEEVAFWDARLLALDAHTGRRIVPMCFQAEVFGHLTGTQISGDVASPLFRWAPQRTLYPDSGAQPSSESVASFLKKNGINYIYSDAVHPNSLVPNAFPIAVSGATQVLRIP